MLFFCWFAFSEDMFFFPSAPRHIFFFSPARGRKNKKQESGWIRTQRKGGCEKKKNTHGARGGMVLGATPTRRRGGNRRRKHAAYGNEEVCSDLYCSTPVYAKHLCRRCYNNALSKATSTMTCTKFDCRRKRFRRTLCNAHYVDFLRGKSPTVKRCAVTTCRLWCARHGTRYCSSHDSVYGEGVSKDTKRHLTPAAILRTAIVTKQMFDLLPPEQLAGLGSRAHAV